MTEFRQSEAGTAIFAALTRIVTPQGGCAGKIQYPDLDAAEKAARVMHRKHKKQFDAYHCPNCGHKHVGTRRKA